MKRITVDGIDYDYEVACSGDVVRVYDITGQLIADCEFDGAVEQCFYSLFSAEDGKYEDGILNYFELEGKPEETARTLIAYAQP